MKKYTVKCLSPLMALMLVPAAFAAPPLPLHSVEGFGGILITGSAWLVNPAEDDSLFGLPSMGATFANLGNGRNLEAYTLTETIGGRVELGYAFNRLDLGDLDTDIMAAALPDIKEDNVELHHFNARALLLKDGDLDQSWMPAVTLGLHYKYNSTIDDIDSRLGGALDGIGLKDNDGVDVTLYASKLFTSTPRPFFINAGLRSTKAAQIGLLGFTDKRKTLFEANFGVLVLDNLVIGGEYRQKPDEYAAIPTLIEREDDWWSAFITYVVNDNMTASVAYIKMGDVLNHKANDTYGFKLKFEL
ncbi:MAG: DUF3034 family protein [Candidatus Polarisedimenticolaceae bacterium]|nr:DUF3034 family protein [Candidatus Polarisedimenticolaceae bacterium]